ncbi:unnamed protein product [Amoebophrya sp. A120]|nr:unnamed protein product [Amoebophrya sp. A120]|eukprot:GSA120T00005435001.1
MSSANADGEKIRGIRTQQPYTGIWEGRAGKETSAKSPAETTDQPKGFRSATLGAVEYGSRIGKASGCRYETVPTGYSTPYLHAAPYPTDNQLFKVATEHLEYGKATRHFQQNKPKNELLTKKPFADELFEKSIHPMFRQDVAIVNGNEQHDSKPPAT